MYLKTIFLFKQDNERNPKPVDLVRELGLSKSSVSEMLKKLDSEGLLKYESYSNVVFTAKGLKYAQKVLYKYLVIEKFLIKVLKIDKKKAFDEACDLEHGFSDESVKKLEKLVGKH